MDDSKDLKAKVIQWWNEHPMDYLDWTWDRKLDKEKAKIFFQQIDSEFRKAAYFAQKSTSDPLFAKLIQYEEIIGKQVLEVGCGLGAHAAEMARNGSYVTAIDITESGVNGTLARFKAYDLKGNIIVQDAEQLAFDDESFDFVWSWGVLHHTPDTPKAINEIYRVLKPGCEARVMLYNKFSIMTLLTILKGGKRNFLKYAILDGCKMKQYMQELRNRFTDGENLGGTPLAKYYSRKEVKSLFTQFGNVRISTYDEKSKLISLVSRLFRKQKALTCFAETLPNWVYNIIYRRVGNFLFIKAVK